MHKASLKTSLVHPVSVRSECTSLIGMPMYVRLYVLFGVFLLSVFEIFNLFNTSFRILTLSWVARLKYVKLRWTRLLLTILILKAITFDGSAHWSCFAIFMSNGPWKYMKSRIYRVLCENLIIRNFFFKLRRHWHCPRLFHILKNVNFNVLLLFFVYWWWLTNQLT